MTSGLDRSRPDPIMGLTSDMMTGGWLSLTAVLAMVASTVSCPLGRGAINAVAR